MAQSAKKTGANFDSNPVTNNYVKFAASDWSGLTIATKDADAARTGFTLGSQSITECAYDGDTGGSAIVLPEATVGELCVYRFTAVADGGQTITFTTASGDFYAAGTLNTDVTNFGDAHPHGRSIKHISATQTVATFGGAIVTVAATHNRLSIATTATHNQTNVGAELAFFCEQDGFWRISFKGSELGSGALNATFETSAV